MEMTGMTEMEREEIMETVAEGEQSYEQWDEWGNAIKLTISESVGFAEYGETVNPLRDFRAFSKMTEMLREMSIPDEGVLKEQMTWCHLDSMERLENGGKGYVASFCQPKDADFVLIRQLVRLKDQTTKFRLSRDFLGLENTIVLEDVAYGVTLMERLIFAPLDYCVRYIKVDNWRTEAQKEFECWRERATTDLFCRDVKNAVRFIRRLANLEERLLDLDWDWAKDLEEISFGLTGESVRLPADWQKSLKYYPNKADETTISWLDETYCYNEENVEYIEKCVTTIEPAVSTVRRNQIMRQKYLLAAKANRISYTVYDASDAVTDEYISVSPKCENLYIDFRPSMARLFRVSSKSGCDKHLGDFVYFGKEGANDIYEAFLTTLDRATEKKINLRGWCANVVDAVGQKLKRS